MAEATIAPALEGSSGRRTAIGLALGIGSGVASGAAGALLGGIAAWSLLGFGKDYVTLSSVVTRVMIALAIIIAGVMLARYDRLPLTIGAGALVGGPVGVVFGGVAWSGLGWALALGAGFGVLGFLLTCTQIPPLVRRELNAYFLSPVVYVVATIFLLIFGLMLYLSLSYAPRPVASLNGPMAVVTGILLPIMAPILTMRLLAEEKRSGTIEVLMTAPVRDWEVVTAKFLSALSAFGMILAPTLIHVLALYLVSQRGPAPGPLIGGYLGILLTAALFLSLGLLASALSRDQIVAAIIGFALALGVFLLGVVSQLDQYNDWFSEYPFARKFSEFVSYGRHMDLFLQGKIETRSVFFFVSLVVFILFLTVRLVESRKWR